MSLYDEFFNMASESSEQPPSPSMKGITVRLDAELLCDIEALCYSTGMKRQALLYKVISGGVSEAVKGYLEAADDHQNQDFHNVLINCQEQYPELDPQNRSIEK
jgi:hypothetical protein